MKRNQPDTKVSIVTPSLNQAPFIERTIASVLSQDWPSIEYVVFDGGSPDGTVDILTKYGDRLHWVSQPDGGQADAVNKGILATSGQIIGWINSDDIYYAGAIRSAAEYLAANPDVDVVYGMADYIDLNDRAFEAYWTEPWNLDRMQWHCFICQPAAFFRRSVVERHGLLDVKLMYCMDYEYWLRLGAAGVRFGYLERKLAGSRMYAANKTQAARLKVHKEINDMFYARLGEVPARWITNYAHAMVAARISSKDAPRRYVAYLLLQYLLAQLRWNRPFSTSTFRLVTSVLSQRYRSIASRSKQLIANLATRRILAGLLARGIPRHWNRLPDTSADPIRERDGVRLVGIYEDGWAHPTIALDFPAGNTSRSMNINVFAPNWLPIARFNLIAYDGHGRFLVEYPIPRGETVLVHMPLVEAAGTLRIGIEPHFRPGKVKRFGQPDDWRHLTVMVQRLELRSTGGSVVIFSNAEADAKTEPASVESPSA